MKLRKQTFILIFVISMFAALVPASTAFAQFASPYPDLVTCSGAACQWCDVFEMIQRVFNTAVYIMFPLVVVFIMYSAILYIMGSTSGSENSISKARSTATDAIIGLIIMLLTFLIVNATIAGLTGSKLENFLNVDCSVIDTSPPIFGGGGGDDGGGDDGGGGEEEPQPVVLPTALGNISEETARSIMENAQPRIQVNKAPCAQGQVSNCTNLAGMRDATIQGILRLNQECGCNLMITGGTEPGHSNRVGAQYTHARGYKVDFDDRSDLNNFIESNPDRFRHFRTRSNGDKEYKDRETGAIYARERTHWDVTFF